MASSRFVQNEVQKYNKEIAETESGMALSEHIGVQDEKVSHEYSLKETSMVTKPVIENSKLVSIPSMTDTRRDSTNSLRKQTAPLTKNPPRNPELPPKPPLLPQPSHLKNTFLVRKTSILAKDGKIFNIQKTRLAPPSPPSQLAQPSFEEDIPVPQPAWVTKEGMEIPVEAQQESETYSSLNAKSRLEEANGTHLGESTQDSSSFRFPTSNETEEDFTFRDNIDTLTPMPQPVSYPADDLPGSMLQLEIDDSDEEWLGDEGEINPIDSDDITEVQIRHKRDSHGLLTKSFIDATDISSAMKYVSGFYDLPQLEGSREIGKRKSPIILTDAVALEDGTKKIVWKDLSIVQCNPIFKKMDTHNRNLHETIFEIMATESIFIGLLNTFEEQKKNFPTRDVMTDSDRDMLFSRLLLVKQCAESLYHEMEGCWQENIFLHGIFEIIEKHVTKNFSVYVAYCTKQAYINKLFDKLKTSSSSVSLSFALKAFHSFLMLPMQRITRFRSLIESVLQQMSDTDNEFTSCKSALHALRKKVDECSEDVQSGDRLGGLLELSSRFVFPEEMQSFPLISASRWLRRQGAATLRWRQDAGDEKASLKEDVEMFLFNDVFFICTRKRRDKTHLVVSYCRHSLVEMTQVQGDFLPTLPLRYATDRPAKYVFVVDVLCNQDGRREIMVMSASSERERDAWLKVAPPPPIADTSSDICYEPWDCPVVVAVLPFKAATPYQLSLAVNDKLHVTKRKTIGWYEGERLSDRNTGFFPVNYTIEIESPHKKAREVREKFYFPG